MSNFVSEFIDGNDGKKNILIPALQRDYVQGERKDIITPFIVKLLSALKGESTLDLNYIYGSHENEKNSNIKYFVPIDGQQRLITLWLLYLYLYNKLGKEFSVALRFYSREFANNFSEKLAKNIKNINHNGEALKDEIIDSPWFVKGWINDRTVNNMLNTLEVISKLCQNPDAYEKFENITFSFLDMKAKGLTDDIYVKMNGRGRPLSYFENLKSFMDEQVVKNFGPDSVFTKEWQNKMDNEWTNFFWKNRNTNQEHQKEIDDEQERFLYNMLRIFWTKKDKTGFLIDDEDKTQRVIDVLEIEDRDFLEQKILSKISKSENFTLPLTVLDNLNLFSPDFFVWIKNVLNKLSKQTDKLNSENIEFDFDEKKTLTNEIFFNEENRHLLCASAIIDYILLYQDSNFHDWIRFVRNIVCNIDDVSDYDNNFINKVKSFEKISSGSKGNILAFLSELDLENNCYTGLVISEEEKTKAKLLISNDKTWRSHIEKLENNKYFIGQIKFIFDFASENPETDDFDKYAKMMNKLFSGKNSCFSEDVDVNTFSRALLCFSTPYGFGKYFDNNGKWIFLNTGKHDPHSWKKYINGNFNTDENQNLFLKKLLDYIYDSYKGEVTVEVLKKIIDDKKEKINDWRIFFVKYSGVWDYMKYRLCKWSTDFNINLIKSVNTGDTIDHAELRSYCLYLDYKTNYPDRKIDNWTFNFYQRNNTCLYFDKQIASNMNIAIDVYFDAENAESENRYTLEIFLRPEDDESEDKANKRSIEYLENRIDSDKFKKTTRGFKLKSLYPKKQIKEELESILNKDFD